MPRTANRPPEQPAEERERAAVVERRHQQSPRGEKPKKLQYLCISPPSARPLTGVPGFLTDAALAARGCEEQPAAPAARRIYRLTCLTMVFIHVVVFNIYVIVMVFLFLTLCR